MIVNARESEGANFRRGSMASAVDEFLDSIPFEKWEVVEQAVEVTGDKIPWDRFRMNLSKSAQRKGVKYTTKLKNDSLHVFKWME